jgi:hypothetical protein
MPNPHVNLSELLKTLNDLDPTTTLDDEIVRVDPIESQPGEDVPIESGPILWEDPAYPGDDPNYPPEHDPNQGPKPDEGYDPTQPPEGGYEPDCGTTGGSDEPFPEDGHAPDVPAPEEPEPGDYPEDKNCWDPAYY